VDLTSRKEKEGGENSIMRFIIYVTCFMLRQSNQGVDGGYDM
jgi:hypothetical protein